MTHITFIGGGNMASSMIGGLIAKGCDAPSITVSDPLADTLSKMQKDFGVNTTPENAVAVSSADIVVLAVKPQVMKSVCENLCAALPAKALVISIAAGITLQHLSQWLGENIAAVRCMPNTPALIQAGATAAVPNALVSPGQRKACADILQAVGLLEWLDDEALLDSVTALSGSGPAYFFLLLEAMIDTGIEQGLPETVARNLAVQTCIGAGQLARHSDVDVAELRRRVTSPGGTTQKAIESFEAAGFEDIVKQALNAARNRARELAQSI